MFEQTFADGNSVIHRLDPRVKAVAAFGFAMLVAMSDRFEALVPALILSVALVCMARLSPGAVGGRLAVVNGFVAFLWLTMPFTYPGDTVFSLGPLAASRQGIALALLVTLKSNAIVLCTIALLSTAHLSDLGRALSRLRVPDKLVHILLFMMRYLGETWHEYQRLGTAMKVRSFRPRTGPHTYRSYANMIGVLLVGSYSRAEAVYAAMLCRGFSGKFYSMDDFEIRGRDLLFGGAMLAALLLVALLQWSSLSV